MDLIYKLEEVAPPVFIDRELYKYRQLPDSQSHHPQKRERMLRSTLRVYRNALKRRKLSGLPRFGYELYILNAYWVRQTQAPRTQRLAHFLLPYTQSIIRRIVVAKR